MPLPDHDFPLALRLLLRRTTGGRTMVLGTILSDLCADGMDRRWTGHIIFVPREKLIIRPGTNGFEMRTSGMGADGLMTSVFLDGTFTGDNDPNWREEK